MGQPLAGSAARHCPSLRWNSDEAGACAGPGGGNGEQSDAGTSLAAKADRPADAPGRHGDSGSGEAFDVLAA